MCTHSSRVPPSLRCFFGIRGRPLIIWRAWCISKKKNRSEACRKKNVLKVAEKKTLTVFRGLFRPQQPRWLPYQEYVTYQSKISAVIVVWGPNGPQDMVLGLNGLLALVVFICLVLNEREVGKTRGRSSQLHKLFWCMHCGRKYLNWCMPFGPYSQWVC